MHHITIVGSNRQDTIDFYEGVLGMPFVFEQPNLDVPDENHLYFDAGDGCLITFFVREDRETDRRGVPQTLGSVHHIAYAVSRETYERALSRLNELGYPNSGRVDRGFMDSLYFRDLNGLLLELSVYKFTPPPGKTAVEVLAKAHAIRLAKGDYNIADEHLDAAVAALSGIGAR
jgi:catechol 2,3-dioxygenase-like lactoylglutathione lyase family enzyme